MLDLAALGGQLEANLVDLYEMTRRWEMRRDAAEKE
jgi:hypothetical protein